MKKEKHFSAKVAKLLAPHHSGSGESQKLFILVGAGCYTYKVQGLGNTVFNMIDYHGLRYIQETQP
jgi:hypothetical protein